MYMPSMVFVVCIVAISYNFVGSQQNVAANEETTVPADTPDNHTFVAFIDVVFTDGRKITCSGAIIDNHVVVTVGHCFIDATGNSQAELTASFVVIGTKKMFFSSYEKYLPIEKIIIHPDMLGWTSDLALVYTFAGMTGSDGPGNVMPLETGNYDDESDLTVMSWGRRVEAAKFEESDSFDCNNGDDSKQRTADRCEASTRSMRKNHRFSKMTSTVKDITRYRAFHTNKNNSTFQERITRSMKVLRQFNSIKTRRFDVAVDQLYTGSIGYNNAETKMQKKKKPRMRTNFNWRRKMGSQKNALNIDIFHFIHQQQCIKIVEKSNPPKYANPNEILCYANDATTVTSADSGAPAIRGGKLVAVTLGGTLTNNYHLAVGIKLACYCSWIEQNLPGNNSSRLHCCKNCCDEIQLKRNKFTRGSRYLDYTYR